MMAWVATIEHSSFITWVRESGSVWSYPSFLFAHTIGLAFLVGLNVAIDLRLLGAASRLPLAPLRRLFALMWMGFWMSAISGSVLLAADATVKLTSAIFYIKIALVAIAVSVLLAIRRMVFDGAELDVHGAPPAAKALAGASLICWAGVITAGRLMAYFSQPATG